MKWRLIHHPRMTMLRQGRQYLGRTEARARREPDRLLQPILLANSEVRRHRSRDHSKPKSHQQIRTQQLQTCHNLLHKRPIGESAIRYAASLLPQPPQSQLRANSFTVWVLWIWRKSRNPHTPQRHEIRQQIRQRVRCICDQCVRVRRNTKRALGTSESTRQ